MKAVVLLLVVLCVLGATATPRNRPNTRYPIRNACTTYVRVVHAFGANITNPPDLRVVIHYGTLGKVNNVGNGAIQFLLSYGEPGNFYPLDNRVGQASVAAYYTNDTLALRTTFHYGTNEFLTVILSGPTLAPAQEPAQVFQSYPNSNPFVILEDTSFFSTDSLSNSFWKARFYNFLDGVATYDLRILDSLNKEAARISQVPQKTVETSPRLLAGTYSFQVTLKGATNPVAAGNTTAINSLVAGRNDILEFWLFGNPFTSKLPNTAQLRYTRVTAEIDENDCNTLE